MCRVHYDFLRPDVADGLDSRADEVLDPDGKLCRFELQQQRVANKEENVIEIDMEDIKEFFS